MFYHDTSLWLLQNAEKCECATCAVLPHLHGFSLRHEFSESLLRYGGRNALRFLELGPQVEVRLGLVMGDGIGIVLLCCE